MTYDDRRPDPDALLNSIDELEKKQLKGQLRVFLGMSAGVGKTYSMLNAARQRKKDGLDVVIGVVETHGRSETAALIEGLEVIPRREIEYKGTKLTEFDIDEILKRKPDLVIIDELAHTNIPGSRHEKRYQDVLEILDAGINVYTALNVQHLESRKDSVEAITGIQIRETVPDSILERASLVEVVDIAPTELLKRLKEGKVYLGDKADRAAQNFFKEDRLTALREIALRMTAERVDHDLQRFVSVRQEVGRWQTNERLLVAISHSPYSERLIRATRRLAYNLEAPWVAVYVNTGLTLNDEDQAQLAKNLNLATELNAEVITTTEVDLALAIRKICRQKNITQVIVGRPTRRWFRDIIEGGSLLERLITDSGEVDIHVIRQQSEFKKTDRPSLFSEISYYRSSGKGSFKYYSAVTLLTMITAISFFIEPFIGYRAVGFIYLLAVLIVGMFGSIGAVTLAAFLSSVLWNFFFIPPRFTFVIQKPDDLILCVAFFVVALITGFLTNRIRFHERLVREREERTNVLYEILQTISNSQEKSEFLRKINIKVGSLLKAECGSVLKNTNGELKFDSSLDYTLPLSEKEQAVALWCFQNQKRAGWSTDTLSQSDYLYIPLQGHNENVGVFIFKPIKKTRKLDLEQQNLLSSITGQLGISIERHFLSKRLLDAQRLKDSEELHQTLLNSISHEMRTPLTAILGSVDALENKEQIKNQDYVLKIADSLQEAGERLNRVIENLLDMSRLNSGVLSLKLEWHDLNDLINVITKKLEKPLSKFKFKIEIENSDQVKLIYVDFRLFEHALSNIILNATMYCPAHTEIKLTVKKINQMLQFEMSDQGAGIPEADLNRIFEKFYRVPGAPTGGTGLGLSIVKSIIELHKGSISVSNLIPSGACFKILLPYIKLPEVPNEVKT